MPAVIDPNACNKNFEHCFPARICPEKAISMVGSDVVIDSDLCGPCPGPCVNFCDGYAIRYDPDPESFDIMRRRILQEMSADDALEARKQLEQRREREAASNSAVVNLDADTFQSTIRESDLPIIVDFWAAWCGPCKQFAPIFERLASEYENRILFAKVNVDEQPQIAATYGISSIPTLLIFQEGQAIDGAVGAIGEAQLRSMLDRLAPDTDSEEGEILDIEASE